MTAPSVYAAVAMHGNCRICKRMDDLRFGVCFTCSDRVGGEKITKTAHRLWDMDNPRDTWVVDEKGDA